MSHAPFAVGRGPSATVRAGNSIQRDNDTDSNNLNGWTMAASSWGAINAGQVPLP